jgi:hypothetical protein
VIEQDTTRVRVVSAGEVERFGGPELALRAARTAARVVREPDTVVKRINFRLPGGFMRVLGAALPSLGVFGYKEFHYAPGGVLRYVIHLFSTEDGRPLGIVDAALITTLRTAAGATVAATAYFDGRTEPLTVGVIGSGAEALAGLRALASALPVAEARVSSRNEAKVVCHDVVVHDLQVRRQLVEVIRAGAAILPIQVDLDAVLQDLHLAHVADRPERGKALAVDEEGQPRHPRRFAHFGALRLLAGDLAQDVEGALGVHPRQHVVGGLVALVLRAVEIHRRGRLLRMEIQGVEPAQHCEKN